MKNTGIITKMLAIFIALTMVVSCEKEKEDTPDKNEKGEISFSFASKTLKSSNCDLSNVVSALVTIETSSGETTDFDATPLTVYKMNGEIFTQKIALPVGQYNLTEFLLVDAHGNVLFAVPIVGSEYADFVDNPLPLALDVEKDKSQDYTVQILCVQDCDCTPGDFGLSWFVIDQVDLCCFSLSVSELGSNTLLDGEITITASDYVYSQAISSDVVPNKVYYKCNYDQYTIEITSPGYQPYVQTMTASELEAFCCTPKVVELLPVVCGETVEKDLVADMDQVIGKVIVSKNGQNVDIEYVIESDEWYLLETNVSITPSKNDVLVTSTGDPDISQFTVNTTHDPILLSYKYEGLSTGGNNNVAILAHAIVQQRESNLNMLDNLLPPEKVKVMVNYQGDPHYFQTTITGAGDFNGTYPGNCVDLDHFIYSGKEYEMNMVSSYSNDDMLLSMLVDKPQNLDNLNYMINQDYSVIGATGAEEQAAIWTLIDDKNPTSELVFDQSIVDVMVQDALNNGEGFVPHCGHKVLVILDPGVKDSPELKTQVTIAQVTTISINNICNSTTTELDAWADGVDFGGAGWAMYFDYCLE